MSVKWVMTPNHVWRHPICQCWRFGLLGTEEPDHPKLDRLLVFQKLSQAGNKPTQQPTNCILFQVRDAGHLNLFLLQSMLAMFLPTINGCLFARSALGAWSPWFSSWVFDHSLWLLLTFPILSHEWSYLDLAMKPPINSEKSQSSIKPLIHWSWSPICITTIPNEKHSY